MLLDTVLTPTVWPVPMPTPATLPTVCTDARRGRLRLTAMPLLSMVPTPTPPPMALTPPPTPTLATLDPFCTDARRGKPRLTALSSMVPTPPTPPPTPDTPLPTPMVPMVCTDARRGRLRLTALSSMVPTPPTLTLVPTPTELVPMATPTPTASKPLLDGAMMFPWSRPPSTEHGQAQKRIRRTNNENGRFFPTPILFFLKKSADFRPHSVKTMIL